MTLSFKAAIRRRAATPAAFAVVCCLLFILACVLLTGCKTAAPIVSMPRNDSISIRSRVQRDSIIIRDSVVIRHAPAAAPQQGKPCVDTVYFTRWRTMWRDRAVTTTDTLYRDREVITQLPPERYIPPIYKAALYVCIGLVLYILARILARLYIRR